MFYLSQKVNMIMRLFAILLVFIIISANTVLVITAVAIDNSTTQYCYLPKPITARAQEPYNKTLIEVPLCFEELAYKTIYNSKDGNNYLNTIQSSIERIEAAINSKNYTSEAREIMYQEIIRLEDLASRVESDITVITKWEDEYYYAAKTWSFLTKYGYSEVISSAIIGNMMIETSGGTLSLKPTIYNPTGAYYGLCQWSLKYRPEVADMSFEEQLEYLVSDIEREFNTFGKCYRKGFTYEDFIKMSDPADAAYAFALVYERCGAGSYNLRRQAAKEAYHYFNLNL